METITVKLMTLTGKFTTHSIIKCADMAEARQKIEAHAASGGYTNVKQLFDADSYRYTAKTPGGRRGRNIAYIDLY